jgi:lysine/ornithine N-monooxygenase
LDSLQSSYPGGRPLRIAVIGAGQSAAEVAIDLHSRLASIPVAGEKTHTLDMIIRKGSLKPSDDSPFVNEIFNPESQSIGRIFAVPETNIDWYLQLLVQFLGCRLHPPGGGLA